MTNPAKNYKTTREAICLIPAKGRSTRLIRKNLLPINGKPMVALAIEKALASNLFDTVCVSTEDEEIKSLAVEQRAEVPFTRPSHLAQDPSTITDVMRHAITHYKSLGIGFKKVCVILPTSPFVTTNDIVEANRIFEKDPKKALLSVCQTSYPPFNALVIKKNAEQQVLSPCFPDSPYRYTKSTECPRTYKSNGAILIVKTDQLMIDGTYRSKEMQPYVMPPERSLDIDTETDYLFAKFLVNSLKI